MHPMTTHQDDEMQTSSWRIEGESGWSNLLKWAAALVAPAVATAIGEAIEKAIKEHQFWNDPWAFCASESQGQSSNYATAVVAKSVEKYQTNSSEVSKSKAYDASWSKDSRKSLVKTLMNFDTTQEMISYMQSYQVNGATPPFLSTAPLVLIAAKINA